MTDAQRIGPRIRRALRILATLTLAAAPARAFTVPEGAPLLLNGNFTEGRGRPLNWVTRSTGDLGTFAVTPPAEGEVSGVLTIKVERAHQQPWMLELRQKLSAQLPKGRNLFLGFEYKLSPGYAFHVYWQKDAPPWPKFLALRLSEPAGEWTSCRVAVPVPEDLTPDATSLSFHLAEAPGTLEVRRITAVLVAPHVDLATIDTNYQPVFGGDYYDQDWRDAVLARIEKDRKTDLAVQVTAGGEPVPGVAVTVEQIGRPFLLGIEVPTALLLPEILETEDGAALKRAVGEALPALPRLHQKLADPQLFGMVTPNDLFLWRTYDDWGRSAAAKVLPAIHKRGQKTRGQALFSPAFRDAPAACRRMDREPLLQAALKQVRGAAGEYQGQVDQWVVLHGTLASSEIYDITGVDSLVQIFQTAQKESPETTLLVSDAEALLLPGDSRIDEVIEFVTWLKSAGCKVSGILLGAALARPYMAPQTIEKRLDRIAASNLGIPVYIGSLQLEADTEVLQESMLRDLLRLFYSHATVAGVSLANPWEPAALNPRSALYHADMSPRKAGRMIETLFAAPGGWATRAEGVTDAQGQFALRAFHGTYRVSADLNGRKLSAEGEVSPTQKTLTLKAD